MLVYIAGKYTARSRLKRWAKKVEALDAYTVTSSWLNNTPEHEKLPEYRKAVIDRTEVGDCDLLILDTQNTSMSGGREVEFGIALGGAAMIYRVGPKRNIFHSLTTNQFDTWPLLMEHLYRLTRLRGEQ